MNRSSGHKGSKDVVELSNTINQLCNRHLCNSRMHILFQLTWNIHQAVLPHVGHKTHLHNFRRIEIIQCLLSDHNEIKLENTNFRGNWVAQLIKCPTLDFSSGQDLRMVRSSPSASSAQGGVCLRFSLSFSLSTLTHALSLVP